jgi:hypothetical protein
MYPPQPSLENREGARSCKHHSNTDLWTGIPFPYKIEIQKSLPGDETQFVPQQAGILIPEFRDQFYLISLASTSSLLSFLVQKNQS